jgi:hypothetical protein
MNPTDAITIYSASLPLTVTDQGWIIPWVHVRPWNGRALSYSEVIGCVDAARCEHARTGSYGLASQAAFEWLSEHAL